MTSTRSPGHRRSLGEAVWTCVWAAPRTPGQAATSAPIWGSRVARACLGKRPRARNSPSERGQVRGVSPGRPLRRDEGGTETVYASSPGGQIARPVERASEGRSVPWEVFTAMWGEGGTQAKCCFFVCLFFKICKLFLKVGGKNPPNEKLRLIMQP